MPGPGRQDFSDLDREIAERQAGKVSLRDAMEGDCRMDVTRVADGFSFEMSHPAYHSVTSARQP